MAHALRVIPLPASVAAKVDAEPKPKRKGAVTARSVMVEDTGKAIPVDEWRERSLDTDALKHMTEHLCDVLERNGIQARAETEVKVRGDVTGEISDIDAYRCIRFLPLVAKRDRRPMLNALRLYAKETPKGRYLRYAVITSGDRVPWFDDLRKRHRQHTKAISRWASEALAQYGVEVVFRGTEQTLDEVGVHHHSNVVMKPTRLMSKERWTQFLGWSRQRLGGVQWRDCGLVKDWNEIVKYAIKPAEMMGLDDSQVVWLYEQMHRMKLAQPMGSFADYTAQLDADGCKVGSKAGKLVAVEKEKREPREGGGGPGENVLVCRTLPQARFSPYAETCSLLINYTPTPATPDGWRRLAVLNRRGAEAREWWDANGAPDPRTALAVGRGQNAAAEGREADVVAFPGNRSVQMELALGGAGAAPFILDNGRLTAQAENGLNASNSAGFGVVRVASREDGLLYDADTGEILWERPDEQPDPLVLAEAMRQATECTTEGAYRLQQARQLRLRLEQPKAACVRLQRPQGRREDYLTPKRSALDELQAEPEARRPRAVPDAIDLDVPW